LIEPSDALEPARSALKEVEERYEFVPNLYRAFAHAPPAVHAYLTLSERFGDTSSS
jgi:hypothetical protein